MLLYAYGFCCNYAISNLLNAWSCDGCCSFGHLYDSFLTYSLLYWGAANFFWEAPDSNYFWFYSIRPPLQLPNGIAIFYSHRRQCVNKWVCLDLAIILLKICWPFMYSTLSLISLKSNWSEEALWISPSLSLLSPVVISKYFIISARRWLSDLWSWLM